MFNKQTLLEKAMDFVPKNRINPKMISDEHLELCVAYLQGRVTLGQVSKALNINKNEAYVRMCTWMREAYTRGYILT